MIKGLSTDKRLYSFDLFDTLVSRPLKRPIYLFDLVELGDAVSYRFPFLGLAGFRFWRRAAEHLSRFFSKHEDVHLKDIYRTLGWIIRNPAKTLRQELTLEFALIQPIPEHVDVLARLLAEGKRCCIITDVYLSPWFIRKIIRRKVGHDVEFFASSAHGLTKASGNLFKLVSASLDIGHHEIAHIGDNPHSDVHQAGRLGIAAHKVPERSIHDPVNGLFEYFTPREAGRGIFYRLGYSLVGPLCIAFASYIGRDMQRRGIRKVFFGARDGYLVKEAFELLGFDAESRYLRLSRRALYVPAFAFHKTHEKFFEGRVSAQEFFGRLDLPTPPSLSNLDPSRNRQLFEETLAKIHFAEKASAEAEVLVDYLAYNDFSGKLAFVDLGWRGTLQDSLKDMLGIGCEIHGYYFGTFVGGDDKHAFYFKNHLPLKRFARVFQAIPVFEFLFTEPVTSLKHINKTAEGFGFEFLNDETESQITAREEIASGCRSFFADFSAVASHVKLSDHLLLKQADMLIEDFLCKPDEAAIRAFGGITHAEGFGGSKNLPIVSETRFSLPGYRNSYWRAAYVSIQGGLNGIYARAVHTAAQCSLTLFLLHKSYRLRQLIDRLTS